MLGKTHLRVMVLETDFYARQAINSYLAWDRRTSVVYLADSIDSAIGYVRSVPSTEWPNVVVLDARAADSPDRLAALIERLEETIPQVMTLVLDDAVHLDTIRAIEPAHVNGYLIRNELRIRIASAICWAQQHDFVVTQGVKDALKEEFSGRLFRAQVIPDRRAYPELTARVQQALQLCVVEGMSAELAADEMGISAHTVRSYVKEGYRILETYDDTIYPPDLSPQEKAFMRFTALVKDSGSITDCG